MEDRELKNQIPCLIEQGILYNHRDMIRVLRDLGHVRYLEIVADTVRVEGEGYVVSVVSSSHSATVFINKRLYINVNGFEFLRLFTDPLTKQAQLDLVDTNRTLRLLPISDPLTEEQPITAEPLEREMEEGALSDEEFAEMYLEDEFNDDFEDR